MDQRWATCCRAGCFESKNNFLSNKLFPPHYFSKWGRNGILVALTSNKIQCRCFLFALWKPLRTEDSKWWRSMTRCGDPWRGKSRKKKKCLEYSLSIIEGTAEYEAKMGFRRRLSTLTEWDNTLRKRCPGVLGSSQRLGPHPHWNVFLWKQMFLFFQSCVHTVPSQHRYSFVIL